MKESLGNEPQSLPKTSESGCSATVEEELMKNYESLVQLFKQVCTYDLPKILKREFDYHILFTAYWLSLARVDHFFHLHATCIGYFRTIQMAYF